jgi:hypothetical protein
MQLRRAEQSHRLRSQLELLKIMYKLTTKVVANYAANEQSLRPILLRLLAQLRVLVPHQLQNLSPQAGGVHRQGVGYQA